LTKVGSGNEGIYNRKEKSLGQLCKKFLNLYGSEKYCLICLDACTQKLCVERRRLYDIINILESFSAVSRKAKNVYEWKGLAQISKSIAAMEVILSAISYLG
jgi:transcription factor E2F7/8